jgi:hypothetical protein
MTDCVQSGYKLFVLHGAWVLFSAAIVCPMLKRSVLIHNTSSVTYESSRYVREDSILLCNAMYRRASEGRRQIQQCRYYYVLAIR